MQKAATAFFFLHAGMNNEKTLAPVCMPLYNGIRNILQYS